MRHIHSISISTSMSSLIRRRIIIVEGLMYVTSPSPPHRIRPDNHSPGAGTFTSLSTCLVQQSNPAWTMEYTHGGNPSSPPRIALSSHPQQLPETGSAPIHAHLQAPGTLISTCLTDGQIIISFLYHYLSFPPAYP